MTAATADEDGRGDFPQPTGSNATEEPGRRRKEPRQRIAEVNGLGDKNYDDDEGYCMDHKRKMRLPGSDVEVVMPDHPCVESRSSKTKERRRGPPREEHEPRGRAPGSNIVGASEYTTVGGADTACHTEVGQEKHFKGCDDTYAQGNVHGIYVTNAFAEEEQIMDKRHAAGEFYGRQCNKRYLDTIPRKGRAPQL